jgi:hypothetical protein
MDPGQHYLLDESPGLARVCEVSGCFCIEI